MKPQSFVLCFLILAPACGGGGSGKSRPEKATFQVKVSETDAEGGLWDRLDSDGKPDIALCVESRVGKRCYPDDKLYSSQCPDSFTCNFASLPIPAEKFFSALPKLLPPQRYCECTGSLLRLTQAAHPASRRYLTSLRTRGA